MASYLVAFFAAAPYSRCDAARDVITNEAQFHEHGYLDWLAGSTSGCYRLLAFVKALPYIPCTTARDAPRRLVLAQICGRGFAVV